MRYSTTLIIALLLAACATNNTKPSPAQTVYGLRATYDSTVLVPAAQYAKLPLCSPKDAEIIPSAAAPPFCSRPDILRRIANANHAALIALDKAEEVVRGKEVGPADEALRIAEKSISAASGVLQQYGLATGKI